MAGAVVLVARKGQIAYFEPFGQADTDKPMQKDTMFRIASMTKPLVTVSVLQLYEEGRLLLSDPVAKYIPEFARPKVLEMLPEGSNPPFKLVPANGNSRSRICSPIPQACLTALQQTGIRKTRCTGRCMPCIRKRASAAVCMKLKEP